MKRTKLGYTNRNTKWIIIVEDSEDSLGGYILLNCNKSLIPNLPLSLGLVIVSEEESIFQKKFLAIVVIWFKIELDIL